MQKPGNRALEIVKDPAVLSNIEQHVREHFGVRGAAPVPRHTVTYINRHPAVSYPGSGASAAPPLQQSSGQPVVERMKSAAPEPKTVAPSLPRETGQAAEGSKPKPSELPKPKSFQLPVAVRAPETGSGRATPCLCKARLIYGHLELIPEDDDEHAVHSNGTAPKAEARPRTSRSSEKNTQSTKGKNPLKKLLKAKLRMEEHQRQTNMQIMCEIVICVVIIIILFYFLVPTPSFLKGHPNKTVTKKTITSTLHH
ncbi:uncharacterized protein LOC135387150 [Ornithodoros turicata]|uniref:uncharacterized protein LOC135387150 n=1 Tax=Ornithodoros turicata TaxID=34597 RepID=UPI003138B11C